ncbi:MAG: RNA chaperone ProQ [Gammaproteobacteria bacterium]|nr:MAG: RNA chaperone ProQ [Gammaproteobacteria bacterium]
METPVSKSLTNKELIAYLSEKFPKCFIIKGAAKPLKIGIFQELAEQLAEDDKVSKTRLRQVLRHYTSSWRYLKAIKLDAKRVDLQGEEVAEIDQEQADYASKTLKESQEKFGHKIPDKFANKKNNSKAEYKNNRSTAATDNKSRDKSKAHNQKHNAKFNAVKTTKKTPPKPTIKLEQVESSEVKIGQAVKVQLGNSPMDAIVKEVVGKDVSVELTSGMVVKTQTNNLYIESVKAKK